MKKYLSGLITGIIISVSLTAFAAELNVVANPFPVLINGITESVEGYNINGYTFLKLADFKKAGLTIKFNETNQQIEITSQEITSNIESLNMEVETMTIESKPTFTTYNGCDAIEQDGIIYVHVSYLNLYFLSYDANTETISFIKDGKTISFNKYDFEYTKIYNEIVYVKVSKID